MHRTPRSAELLVVDDDAVVLRAVERTLRGAGHHVTLARSCAEARRSNARFDCGVFDVDLGDGDGVVLALELRARGTVRACVFFTGSTEATLAARTEGLGPILYKSEPVAALVDVVACELSRLAL